MDPVIPSPEAAQPLAAEAKPATPVLSEAAETTPESGSAPVETTAKPGDATSSEPKPAAAEQPFKVYQTQEEHDRAVQAETDRREANRKKDERRKAELEAARKGDVVTLGKQRLEELEPELQSEDAKPIREKTAVEVRTAFAKSLSAHVGAEVFDEVAGKFYEGGPEEAMSQWTADVLKAHEKRLEPALFAKWEKERLPVLRKQWLTETNGGEPSPDLGGGGSATTSSDAQFLKDYAAHTTDDHARARKLLEAARGRG